MDSSFDNELDIAINNYPEILDEYGFIEESDNKSDDTTIKGHKSTLQQYFEDVGFIYDKHGNDYDIEFCPENRDKLIEMNLKCVVKIAKGFRGMGLSLEELISAGNEGLCTAFDKYDPNRNRNREELLEKIKSMDDIPASWVEANLGTFCKYGKLKAKYKSTFIDHYKPVYESKFVENWVAKNIKKASFNSVAMLWVAAAIRQELDNYSRLIHKPKVEIEKEKTGESKKEVYLDMNAPVGDDGNNVLGDILDLQDNSISEMEVEETKQSVHNLLRLLVKDIKTRDKRILLQRFGVGYVRPMLPKEISERENISVARVSQIINLTIEKMQNNAKTFGINANSVFEMLDDTDKMF